MYLSFTMPTCFWMPVGSLVLRASRIFFASSRCTPFCLASSNSQKFLTRTKDGHHLLDAEVESEGPADELDGQETEEAVP